MILSPAFHDIYTMLLDVAVHTLQPGPFLTWILDGVGTSYTSAIDEEVHGHSEGKERFLPLQMGSVKSTRWISNISMQRRMDTLRIPVS